MASIQWYVPRDGLRRTGVLPACGLQKTNTVGNKSMNGRKLEQLRSGAFIALGVFLGRGAQADTILDFDIQPAGQGQNANMIQSLGDRAAASSDGVTVVGFGTPNIDLTWQGTGGQWQYYADSVWSAAQLDSSSVGDQHELVFAPSNPSAAAVIKSVNFHPYYLDNERFTYEVSVLAGASIVSGPTRVSFISESAKVPVSINYTGSIGQTLTLRLSRVASTLESGEVEGDPADIAVDDITFAQLPETELAVGPQVSATIPANNQVAVAPDGFYQASITNLSTAVVGSSIQLRLNGSPVSPAPTITPAGEVTTVSYRAPSLLLPPGSTNRYTLTYTDTGAPARSYTNQVQFIVANYVNILLPEPIVFEDFDHTPEGSLPAGWAAANLDGLRDPASEPNLTITNVDSAAYTNWTVVDVERFTGEFDVYSRYFNGNPPPFDWTTDYQRVLATNPSNVVNGVFQRKLATGRMAFANSGYRNDALGQVLYLFSPDFDLTGKADVYLSFHSLWEQNQDSIAAVEYSIDQGASWLPIVYMLHGPDVATNLDGTIDALTTFSASWSDVAHYVDPVTGNTEGGFYGAFIGVDSNRWATLAPHISPRVDDNTTESKRVELFRLPHADNQPKVRLRFAHAGTDSWYFGVDDVGLYSLTKPPFRISSIVRSGPNVIISWDGAAGTRLQKATSLTAPSWQDVPGSDGASSVNEAVSGDRAYYRLVRSN